jgi:hypothetical protein
MNFKRIFKHLMIGKADVRRCFPIATLKNIERTIVDVERTHAGQMRFAVEGALDLAHLLSGCSSRERAIEVFSQLRIWDTELNNGVLIYLLLADRDVEIVADRGVHAKLGQKIWESICTEMESSFRSGKFEQGVIHGLTKVGHHLALHYPHSGIKTNELLDKPVLL